MGAAALKIPELNLSEDEAAKLTGAINRVAILYDFGASEKTLAWVNFAIIVGGMYGTKMIAYNRRAGKGTEKKEPKPAQVIQMPNFT